MKTLMSMIMIMVIGLGFVHCEASSLHTLQYMGKTCFFDNFTISHYSNGVHVVIWDNDAVLDKEAADKLISALSSPNKPVTIKGKYTYDLQLKPFNKGGGYCAELKTVYKNTSTRVLLTDQDIKYVKSCLVVKER